MLRPNGPLGSYADLTFAYLKKKVCSHLVPDHGTNLTRLFSEYTHKNLGTVAVPGYKVSTLHGYIPALNSTRELSVSCFQATQFCVSVPRHKCERSLRPSDNRTGTMLGQPSAKIA